MKLTKLFSLLFILTAITVVSCKSKSAKDMIVGNWKFTDIKGGPEMQMPDSVKKTIFDNAKMEFTKDGKFIVTMMENKTNGTYTVSEDGKTLSTTDEGKTSADVADILEISDTKMVIKNKKEETTLTMAKK